MAQLVIDGLEVIDVEHQDRQRLVRSACQAQLTIQRLDPVASIDAAGEMIAQAVFAGLEQQLDVPHGNRHQAGGNTERLTVIAGHRCAVVNAQHADGHAPRDQGKT